MAGKAGKDAPASRGKSAMKTPSWKTGSLKRKDWTADDDDEIIFESLDSSSSDEDPYKFGKKSSLDSLKTGGKEKVDKSGKSSGKEKVPTGPPKVAIKGDVELEIDLPQNAEIIMDCEAASILQGIQDLLPALSRDSLDKVPLSFDKALKLANNGDLYTKPESVREILQKLKSKGITDGEICMISRVCPERIDEAFALVPSMKAKKQNIKEPLKEALGELAKLRKSTERYAQIAWQREQGKACWWENTMESEIMKRRKP